MKTLINTHNAIERTNTLLPRAAVERRCAKAIEESIVGKDCHFGDDKFHKADF